MPRLLQLGDQLLASVHLAPKHALPALEPIVYELFFSTTPRRSKRADKAAEMLTLREVVTNTLFKQVCPRAHSRHHVLVCGCLNITLPPICAYKCVLLSEWEGVIV